MNSPSQRPAIGSTPDGRRPEAVIVILGVSGLAIAFLTWVIYFRAGTAAGPADPFWPAWNAVCNATAAILAAAGYALVRRGWRRRHAYCMAGATLASVCFLAGYIVHHWRYGETTYAGQGWLRPVYFSILISHVLCSVAALPLVLTALWLAWRRRWEEHRRWAGRALPVWIYVSITGLLIFFFLH